MEIEVVFKLPNKEEMAKRLLSFRFTTDLRERFHPLLTSHAGEEVTVPKCIDLLVLAIHEYTRTLPDDIEHSIKLMMYVNAVWFARALIDDEAVVAKIKRHFLVMMETV